jgi:hemerythrin
MADQFAAASLEEWDPALSTGIASLDAQHKSLFECVDLLARATAERSMMQTFYVMEQLSSYVRVHFAEEEFLMRVHGFPKLADHVREHRAFTNRLHQLRKIYLDRDISVDLVMMLKDWLRHHVAKTDMEYVPYLTRTRDAQEMSVPAAVAATALTRQQEAPCVT